MIKVAILGGSGYTALELIRILLRHPSVEIVAITTRREDRPLISDLHPSLTGLCDLRCEQLSTDSLVSRGAQVAFACLPHKVSMTTVPGLLARGMRVVDLSADYRLRDPNVYAQWYGESHRDLNYLTQAVYGLPEVYGEDIETAQLVANPGCYPQSAILGLAPLVSGKHIDLSSIIIDSKSGVSGAGREPRPTTHFPECNESVSAYNVGRHRHTPEIEQALSDVAGEPLQVLFTPHLMPMTRGILSTIYVNLQRAFTEEQLRDLYKAYYANAPFVRVMAHLPATKDCSGTNFMDISIRVVKEKAIILACEDNLVRGASGVAVQNFNRMIGAPETTALL